MSDSLHFIDGAIVVGYLLGVLAFGLWVGRGQRSTTDYFLGGRSLPWWAVLLSIVATETSTVTFLSIPGITFAAGGDLTFLQITFGYIVGRSLVVWLLLPLFFRGDVFTSYEVLQKRFGPATRRTTSALFLVTRNVSDALRLYLTALVMQIALGLDFSVCVVLIGLITIGYTYFGGARAVMWNDCIQFLVYMIGAAAALVTIVGRLPQGWEQLGQFAVEHDKLRLVDFSMSLSKPTMTFWAGLIGGAFLTGATHGTDQLMVQRYLAARTQRGATAALALSGLIVLLQFALFLVIGIGLACYYDLYPLATELRKDQAFAHLIVHDLPVGLVGFTLAAVFAAAMSTLSSSLNSSATALMSDLYLPLRRKPIEPAAQLRWSRLATAAFGLLQIGIALAAYHTGTDQSVVNQVLAIAGFTAGPVLGIYFLAVLAPAVEERGALVGFLLGLTTVTTAAMTKQLGWTEQSLAWPWYAAVGALATFGFGVVAHFFFAETNEP